ncbi:MAG TPA: BON domain-containing protein [Caulobacteraceae bacterium]|jgi:osmotically-inducible protein OsmY
MTDERRWADRDRGWRGDRDRYERGERGRQDERSFGSYSGGERYRQNESGRQSGGRMDYDAGNRGRFGRESWGGGEPYGASDWPNYATDYDSRLDYRSGGFYGEPDRGYGASRYRSGYGSGAYGSGYGREERSGWGSAPEYWRGEAGRGEYGRGYGYDEDRNWLDKAGDEARSWFGDRDAERRRQMDHIREGEHRGRGPSGYRRSDERIREDVNDRLSDDSWLDATNIEVQVKDCEVTLSGTVHDRHDKRHAEDLADRVSGVRHVQNNLRLKTTTSGLAAPATGQALAGTTTSSTVTTPAGSHQARTSKETM